MPGQKKWCEYCRINLPYDKKAIQDHEATRKHIQNQQKFIKFERIKIQKAEKAAREAAQETSLMSTANIPKAKKGSELDKEVQAYKNDVMMKGKMAIHQLIAEKTKGLFGAPIQYPEKEELVLAQNYKDEEEGEEQEQNFEMWKIDICEQTGKPCFVNRITKAKVYEPPKGYVLSEQQKEQWEETIKICEQIPDPNLEEAGEVGQWEEVEEEEDYFKLNQINPDEDEDSGEIDEQARIQASKYISQAVKKEEQAVKQEPKAKNWMDDLQERVSRNEVSENQVFGTMLSNTLGDCRNIKQKNETLKKLVKSDFEIRATLDAHNDQLADEAQPTKKIGFKPRKMVKKCQLTNQKDMV